VIGIERVYDARKDHPKGNSFLVDRAWPRGVSKDDLSFASWVKEAGPSTELRKWFGHDPKRWAEFQRRYRAELDDDPSVADPLVTAAKKGDVTLLYGAKDTEHNQAIVLRDWLTEQL
jgi:uncharacterized protein YeaO (DUF488 family)